MMTVECMREIAPKQVHFVRHLLVVTADNIERDGEERAQEILADMERFAFDSTLRAIAARLLEIMRAPKIISEWISIDLEMETR